MKKAEIIDKTKELIKHIFFVNKPPINFPTKETILTYKNRQATSIVGVSFPKLPLKKMLKTVKQINITYKIGVKFSGL